MSTQQDKAAKEEWEDIAETYKKRLSNLATRVDDTFKVQEKFEVTKQYAAEHPLVAMAAVIAVSMCSVPIMCFMAFVLGTFFCTFMGFLFVEGILLTVGGMVLGFVLCVAGLISLILSFFVAASWLSFHYGYHVVQKVVDRYNRREPILEDIPKDD